MDFNTLGKRLVFWAAGISWQAEKGNARKAWQWPGLR
jgi:hypothetical protein